VPFIGNMPNKYILNQPEVRNNSYILPIKQTNGENNGYRMFPDNPNDGNFIDEFIQNHKEIQPMNNNNISLLNRLPLPPPQRVNNHNMSIPSLSGHIPMMQNMHNDKIKTFEPMPIFQAPSMPFQSANTFKLPFPSNDSSKTKEKAFSAMSAPPQSKNDDDTNTNNETMQIPPLIPTETNNSSSSSSSNSSKTTTTTTSVNANENEQNKDNDKILNLPSLISMDHEQNDMNETNKTIQSVAT